MKMNKRLVYVLMVIAFTAGILSSMKPWLRIYLIMRGMLETDATKVVFFVNILASDINPLTLFIVSFRLGSSLDVRAELRTTTISIYVGCFLGSFIGWQLGALSMAYAVDVDLVNVWYNVLGGTLTNLRSAISMFFVSFSAISIASIRKYNAKPRNEAS